MQYSSFSQLPQFLKNYLRDFKGDSAEKWVEKPIPALDGHSFIDLVNAKGVRAATQFVDDIGSKFGVPYSPEIPAEYY